MKKILLSFFVLLSLSSCHKMVIVKPEAAIHENKYSHKYPVPIRMDTTVFNVPRGTKIGKYMANYDCKGPYTDLYWTEARKFIKDVELEDVFHDEMSLKGYDVIGDPNRMYDLSDDNARAKYKIGAQITGIRTNLCKNVNFLFNWEEGVSGEMETSVFWQVYSIKKKEVVLEVKTRGYSRLDTANPFGFGILLNESFANAVETLAGKEDLQKLIFTRKSDIVSKRYEKWPFKSLVLKELPLFKDSVRENVAHIRESTVLVRSGAGHGSGFFISNDGYILTNYHVIGDSQEIFVEDEFGKKMVAKLVRTHKGRDIALLKLKGTQNLNIKALPVRESQAEIGEDVFAVGAPLDDALHNTVTKGIVSSWRDPHYGYSLIQADVDIHGGSSGGPLLDRHGNVIGVSVSGVVSSSDKNNKSSIGINFFIPISDALNKLNISFE